MARDLIIFEVLRATVSFTFGAIPVAGEGSVDQADIDAAVAAHAALADAHPGYLTPAEGNAAYRAIGQVARQYQFVSTTNGWTNQPAGVTEYAGTTVRRMCLDLTGCTQIRIFWTGTANGAAGAKLAPQYSLDSGATWFFFDGTAHGAIGSIAPQVSIAVAAPAVSAYAPIIAAARASVLVRIVGEGGDGALDPNTQILAIEVY